MQNHQNYTMSSEDLGYLGCPYELEELRVMNVKLNAKVVEQMNDTQELVLMNNFARESNEYLFKKCLQDRIADIASWRWVLEDLTKRLNEAIGTLKYEHNALRVVISRLRDEMDLHSRDASRPGVLCPLSDSVEDAITQEFDFLRDQKKKFEKLIPILDKQTESLEKTKNRIEADILNKQEALSLEQSCSKINKPASLTKIDGRKKKKRCSPVTRWENRCIALKRAGLQALSKAVIARQQVRGARVHLSIAAQSYAARVDSALRRRLHVNKVKLQDLDWQKDEAVRDNKSLEEELTTTEQNILETMEQERLVEARIADRKLRPMGELTRDEVDRKLRDELGRLRSFSKQLRTNYERITCLQNHLTDCITRVNCCADDIVQVVRIDEERIRARLGEETNQGSNVAPPMPSAPKPVPRMQSPPRSEEPLQVIKEEDEDDYPFND